MENIMENIMENTINNESPEPGPVIIVQEPERVYELETNTGKPQCLKNIIRKLELKKHTTPASNQTKEWVHSNISDLQGQKDSKREKYQRKKIEDITKKECPKCNDRLNDETYEIKELRNPMTKNKKPIPDGLEWTEDFDGKQEYAIGTMYYNFKWVTEGGGAQTRTLRCLIQFIKCQLEHILKNKECLYFVNILDGDILSERKVHFEHLASKHKYKHVKNFVYIGDTYGFIDWFDSINVQ